MFGLRPFPVSAVYGKLWISDERPARVVRMRGSSTMPHWDGFVAAAPRIAAVFLRRHAATGGLCFLATLRPDGFPRLSPMEPQIFEGRLWIHGMPDTAKFRDLADRPRFGLHTATVDTGVGDGDAKVWGTVRDVRDPLLHRRYAEDLFERSGFDLRGQDLGPFFDADVIGASAVEIVDGHLDVTVWREGTVERVVRKR